jgi:hypothetical protein
MLNFTYDPEPSDGREFMGDDPFGLSGDVLDPLPALERDLRRGHLRPVERRADPAHKIGN